MLTASHSFCSPSPFPEQPSAMATASGERGGLFFKGGGKRRGGFPPFPRRQTCGVAAELSRGHTTHIAFPSIHRLKPTHPPAPPPPLPLSAPLTRQFLSCLPLATVVINLFLPVWLAESMGRPLQQVLTLLQGRACSRLTGIWCSHTNTRPLFISVFSVDEKLRGGCCS